MTTHQGLPPGRRVRPDEGAGAVPVLWLSDAPAPAGLWARLHAEHPRTGRWPLLLEALPADPAQFRPWGSGELSPDRMSDPGDHDAFDLLSLWWHRHARTTDELVLVPGACPPPALADAWARDFADELLADHPRMRLGLIPAGCGADALTAAGWRGPVKRVKDTAKLSAVLRDWERRFGARLVGAGFADIHLSIAAPPRTPADARRVAAEHFAFCPDSVGTPEDLPDYAERLVDADAWSFWWG
jgi:hypothetical protein